MDSLWNAIASFIEAIAKAGANAASVLTGYEPVVPDELRK